jgi:hypothetical protein
MFRIMKSIKIALLAVGAMAFMLAMAPAETLALQTQEPVHPHDAAKVTTMTLGDGSSLTIANAPLESAKNGQAEKSVWSRIDLTEIPEPPVYMLLGLGLLFCVQRMMRRPKARSFR